MVMFAWGAKVFFDLYRPPAGAMEIFVVGKQWMWKVQHPDGQREINELHVPIGPPGQAGDGLGGRHPQLLHPGVPREGGRHSRALQHAVVHGHEARPLSTSSAPSTAARSTRDDRR